MINYFYNRSEEKKDINIKGIKSIENFFKEQFDIDTYLIYGTLLGAYRNKDFIPHDHDIDIAYLSKKDNKKEVKKELIEIHKVLEKYKMLGKTFGQGGQTHIKSPPYATGLDLFTSWINTKNNLYIVYKIYGNFNKEILLPFKKINFRVEFFNIPNNSPLIFNYLYKNWEQKLTHKWANTKRIFNLNGMK